MRNIDKYKTEFDRLCKKGVSMMLSLAYEFHGKEALEQLEVTVGKSIEDRENFIADLPSFKMKYQEWYTEAKVLIRQMLPDRYEDFIKAYEVPKARGLIKYDNYVIEDYLRGITQKNGVKLVVGLDAVIPVFQQQLNIFKSLERRFESSLFDIEQLVQADLFDSEVEAAKQLSKNKFYRAAGVICGVVIEKHLKQVCIDHSIKITKSKPVINDLNELLKKEGIVDTGTWRNIQRLGDLRNLCSHNGEREPTKEDLDDLINGVDKIIKTVF